MERPEREPDAAEIQLSPVPGHAVTPAAFDTGSEVVMHLSAATRVTGEHWPHRLPYTSPFRPTTPRRRS